MESTSLNADHYPRGSTSLNAGNYSADAGPSGSKGFRTNYSVGESSFMVNTPRSNLFCEYCKRSVHIMEKYFRLHGYPQGNSQHNKDNHA